MIISTINRSDGWYSLDRSSNTKNPGNERILSSKLFQTKKLEHFNHSQKYTFCKYRYIIETKIGSKRPGYSVPVLFIGSPVLVPAHHVLINKFDPVVRADTSTLFKEREGLVIKGKEQAALSGLAMDGKGLNEAPSQKLILEVN